MNPTPKTLDLIHYGTDRFDFNRIAPVRNRQWTKPFGGVWASPIECEYAWKDWCADNDFNCDRNHQSVRLKFTGPTITIDCEADLDQLAWEVAFKAAACDYMCIDFERMFEAGVHAIHLTTKGERETRWASPTRNLYGWDCESVLIMNPAGLAVVEHLPQPKPRRILNGYPLKT